MQTETIVIGGRLFLTAAYSDPLHAQYIAGCLAQMAERLRLHGGDDAFPSSWRQTYELANDAGVLLPLLAGMLVERGRVWSAERAVEWSEFFGDLTALRDHSALLRAFQLGLRRIHAQRSCIERLTAEPMPRGAALAFPPPPLHSAP